MMIAAANVARQEIPARTADQQVLTTAAKQVVISRTTKENVIPAATPVVIPAVTDARNGCMVGRAG